MPDVSEPHQLQAELMGALFALVSLSNINANPETGAEVVYEKLPDEMLDMLQRDDWFALFLQVVPVDLKAAVQSKREWFEQVRGATLQMIAEDDAAGDGQAAPAKAG